MTGPHVFSEMHQMATRHGRSHRCLVRMLLFPQRHTAQSSSQPPAAVTFLDVLGLCLNKSAGDWACKQVLLRDRSSS